MYAQELKSLQTPLMQELRQIGLNYGNENHTTVSDLIIEFESLLKAAIVSLNHETRFLKLYWKKTGDGMNIQVINREPNQSEVVLKEVVQVVNFADWLTEYRGKLKDSIRNAHQEAVAQVDSRRDEAIQRNALEWEDQQQELQDSSKNKTNTSTKTANTGDQVLSKTKQVSANLIRGNQILQTGVLQSDLNLDELKQQTNSLSQMNDKYSQLGFVFDKTSQLVKNLEKASHQEKRDVYFSLGFLCICVAWVLWRRIFKLPCKIALWLLFRFFKTILMTTGLVRQHGSKPVLAPPVLSSTPTIQATTTASSASSSWEPPSANTESLEHAVDQAMDRIFTHDEL